MELAKRIISYLKKFPDRRIAIDSNDTDFSNLNKDLDSGLPPG